MLSCGHFLQTLQEARVDNFLLIQSQNKQYRNNKLDVIVFGIQFYSQYCRRSRWILARYFHNEKKRPLSIAAHIQRIRSLIMRGRGGRGGRKPIIFVKKFHTPLTFSPKFSCPNKLPGNIFVPQQRSMVPTETSTASHRSRHFWIFCLNQSKTTSKIDVIYGSICSYQLDPGEQHIISNHQKYLDKIYIWFHTLTLFSRMASYPNIIHSPSFIPHQNSFRPVP